MQIGWATHQFIGRQKRNQNMASQIRRIGILTGGGDCPGLNAVIRAVTKTAIFRYNLEVVGIVDGFEGLIQNEMHVLTQAEVSNILTLGGTILGTNNRCDPTRYPVNVDGQIQMQDVSDRVMEHLKVRQLEALVIIGGDGTMSVASHFVRKGVNCIGVPKTIDNDLEGSDMTVGFPTARYIATEALDRIHTTAASHHRAMLVEVMGRNAGWLALHSGVASGADIILLPEIPFDIEKICQKVAERSAHGKRFSIICLSEGARQIGGQQTIDRHDPRSPDPIRLGGVSRVVADKIEQRTGIQTRTTILGHVQRGGTPVPEDRLLATELGHAAIRILTRGKRNRMVVMRGRTVTDIDLLAVAKKQRLVPLDHPLIRAARDVGTCFGD